MFFAFFAVLLFLCKIQVSMDISKSKLLFPLCKTAVIFGEGFVPTEVIRSNTAPFPELEINRKIRQTRLFITKSSTFPV